MKKLTKRKTYKTEVRKKNPQKIFYRTLWNHWKKLPEPKKMFFDFVYDYYKFEKYMEQMLRTYCSLKEKGNENRQEPEK